MNTCRFITYKMKDVYVVIADPTQRELIRLLAEVNELTASQIETSVQHGSDGGFQTLSYLRVAYLVTDRKVGQETRHRLNAIPLQEIQDYVAFYSNFWGTNILHLDQFELCPDLQARPSQFNLVYSLSSSIREFASDFLLLFTKDTITFNPQFHYQH